jgi:predicted TIM-barrel fold metal-dependent hydrolase
MTEEQTMPVIDVDAHYEPSSDWLDEFPRLRAELPEFLPDDDPRFRMDSGEMFAFFVSDDLLRAVPRERRMPIDRLTTPAMTTMFDPERPAEIGYEGASQYQQMVDPSARLAWMDAHGIAHQNVISGAGYTLARAISDPRLGQRALEAINTWMTDHASSVSRRIHPVTSLRFDDLDWVVDELTRMRERGSRAFLASSEPANGVPPNHPDFDRVWSAATDLGMIAHVHVGTSPSMIHPGWANTDDPGVVRFLSVLQPHQSAQIFLAGMVLGGVFERHPKLTVLFSELGVEWFAPTVERMDSMASPGLSPLVIGEYSLPLLPGEYVRRNVRISPLPAPHESPRALLESLPEAAVFSSDYPHFEGNPDPLAHYETELSGLAPDIREHFLGGNIAASYALTGDPL